MYLKYENVVADAVSDPNSGDQPSQEDQRLQLWWFTLGSRQQTVSYLVFIIRAFIARVHISRSQSCSIIQRYLSRIRILRLKGGQLYCGYFVH